LGDGWQPVTAVEFDQEIRSVAKGLIAHGIARGDRVAIMAKTRYEWTILDFAIIYCGAITVPIYETSSAEQIKWILSDSGSALLVVESPSLAAIARPVLPEICREILVITEDAIPGLVEVGRQIPDSALDERIASLGPDDLMTLIYTSGTTGNPKGVTFTHGNFISECSNVVLYARVEFLRPGGSTLLFLPIAHVFGRMIQFGAIHAGLHLAHCGDISRLPQDLGTFKPTLLLAVPRIFEKVYNSAENRAHESGKSKIFKQAVDTAVAYSQSLDSGERSMKNRALHLLFDRLVYSKIRAGLGGRVAAALSGGAPLSPRLGHFFRGAGINILEGYGLTETTAASSVNVRSAQKIGSVGRGYWNNPVATAESMTDDGYFKSGDLGTIDGDGYLYIVGRKKEIIVTSGGKNVAPEVLEDRLRAHPLISQCMVVGDNKPFIAALITLDPDSLKSWARSNKKSSASLSELSRDPALIDVIQSAVDEANKVVSRAESIRKFTLLPVDFTVADGQLTAKLSVKRHVVNQEFAQEIADLFG
jgi:long-chain acyl-CoA synthetase